MAMTTQHTNDNALSQVDEIEALLPWFTTGKLSAADRARVARYLEQHPQTAAHLALAREEQQAVIAGNEAIAAPGRAGLDRLMASIAAVPAPRTAVVPSPWAVVEALAGMIRNLAPRTLGLAAAAAALLLVVQAVTIGTLSTRSTPAGGYTTASGDTTVATEGVQALVTLVPGISINTLTTALNELGATIVDGPKPGGIYRLRLAGDTARTPLAIERIKARTDIFAFVAPTGK
jgi:anti-sigma factor RsiW